MYIELLYLGFPPSEFVLQDDGSGVYIRHWYSARPQPTPAEIAAATLPATKQVRATEIKDAARARILARYPEWRQANLTARAVELLSLQQASGAEWVQMQQVWAWIKSTRARSNQLEAQVNACTSVAAVNAVDISQGWPE